MGVEETTLQNFSGGELSPQMYGRFNLAVYRDGARQLKNFVLATEGPAVYRAGFRMVHHTRLHRIANLQRFDFKDEFSYQLEFTHKKIRFYRDEAIITETPVSISAITNANPGVVTTLTPHGFSNEDEVFIDNADGLTSLNGRSFLVAGVTANDYELRNLDNSAFSTVGLGVHTSSTGSTRRIYEIDSPYTEANDLFKIRKAAISDTLYLTHAFYEPRKLTRTGHTSWTLSLFTRVADTFVVKKTISAITQADPGVVTAAGHGFVDGDIIFVEEVTGMTEVNSQPYIVANSLVSTFTLQDLNGVGIDTTGFGSYSSAGYASKQNLLPSTCEFYESRLWYGGIPASPGKMNGSRAPDSTGLPRYDDFTPGVAADTDAVEFVTPVSGILWFTGTDRMMIAGSFDSVMRVTGSELDLSITPGSIQVRDIDKIGSADVSPINQENVVIYVQRTGLTVVSMEFEALQDGFVTTDRNLVSSHITKSGIKQMTWQVGRPSVAWAVRNDGVLLGMTFATKESIAGWHRHTTGASGEDKFISASTSSRVDAFERLWVCVERVVDGEIRRFIEFLESSPDIPNRQDFFTGLTNEDADQEKFLLTLLQAQKAYNHLDSSRVYDGSTLGLDASATLTAGAVSGDAVTFTASAAVFVLSDVGRQLWKKAINGVGVGRAKILSYVSATQVTCQVISDFDNTNVMAAGDWYLTTDTMTNMHHLEGRTVKALLDGSVVEKDDKGATLVVTAGKVSFRFQASVVHAGLGYEGILEPMNLEFGGRAGPSQSKIRHVQKIGIQFFNSLGAAVGTDVYREEVPRFADMPLRVGSPQPLFSGVKVVPYNDSWARDKLVYVRQSNPLPCEVQFIMIYGEAGDD